MQVNTNFVDINNIKAQAQDQKLNNYKGMTNVTEDEALRKVSDDFESFFTQQLLNISLKDTSVAGKGTGSDIVKGMYTDAVSQQSKGAIGISDLLYDFLSKNNR